MNRRILLHRLAALSALSAASPALVSAQAPDKVIIGESATLKLLKLMDTDKNGKVSRAEFMAFMQAEFDRLDLDHDGELDVKELEQLQINHRGGHTR